MLPDFDRVAVLTVWYEFRTCLTRTSQSDRSMICHMSKKKIRRRLDPREVFAYLTQCIKSSVLNPNGSRLAPTALVERWDNEDAASLGKGCGNHGETPCFFLSFLFIALSDVAILQPALEVAMSDRIVTHRLRQETSKHVILREQLLVQIPDLDCETLNDTLDGLTDLNEVLVAVVRSALDDEVLCEALSLRIKDMAARQRRLEDRALRKRDLARSAMIEAGIFRLSAPDFGASIGSSAPTLNVHDETVIPAAYWRPQPAKLDKVALLAALKLGTAIDGVVLAPPQARLTVRTK